jgi:NADH:ubiquinone oxidoreductase subunit 5 (subunit L)/multisubunit Na+/H+ antiporter MnhA subunit
MRGVVVAVVTLFLLVVLLFVGIVVLEPMATHVEQNHAGALSEVDGVSTIDSIQEVVLKWMVPFVIFGVPVVFATAYYWRREQRLNRSRGGGRVR